MKKIFKLHMISGELNNFIVDRISRGLSENTIIFYKYQLTPWVEWCQANNLVTVESINSDNLRAFFIYVRKTHSVGGTHAFYRAIKCFLRWWDFEVEPDNWKNPIRKVMIPNRPDDPIPGITELEFKSIIAMCKNDYYGKRDRAILSFLYDTGVRVSELCSILMAEVDLITGIVRVTKTKNKRPRYVFMGSKCRREVIRYLRTKEYCDQDFLFTQINGRGMRREGIGWICEMYAVKAGIKSRPSPHDYRRAWFHNTLKGQVNETTVSRVGGHSNTALIPRYNYQDAKDLQEAIGGSSPLGNLK